MNDTLRSVSVQSTNGERQVKFRERELRGSRFRCLLATTLPRPKLVEWTNSVIQPFAEVSDLDTYMPEGFGNPEEARLGETSKFLDADQRSALTKWWLTVPGRANTPNWDLVSTCNVDGRDGLILLEAKAHSGELKPDDSCGAKEVKNRDRICQAIKGASKTLGTGWSLKTDRCYQLSNRFAWASKVASLGVPVVLVYLGFLNAVEMPEPFQDHADWEKHLHEYADGCVPNGAWNSKVMINDTPLIPLIRSTDVNVVATDARRNIRAAVEE